MEDQNETLDVTQAGSEYVTASGSIDLSKPIPEMRKDPVIEFKRFLRSVDLEQWQRDNPHYCIFTTQFQPCNEEGYDVAIYVTCGNLKEFNKHNSYVEGLLKLRQDALMAAAEADPGVITEPPATKGTEGLNIPDPDADLQAPDPKENVVKIKAPKAPLKNA